jgi:hypothetical protein
VRTGYIPVKNDQLMFDALAMKSGLVMPIGVGPVPNITEVRYVAKGIGLGSTKLFDVRKSMLEVELNLMDISSTYNHSSQGTFRPSDYMPRP